MDGPPSHSSRSWSIYGRLEITEHYEILDRIGSGAYSDVYRGRRLSDGLVVALKEIHDYQSSFREIEALQTLRHAPNVVDLIDYFWQEDDDAVLVLEYLPTDLAAVIREGKQASRLPSGEVKQWMLQILRGVDACHKNSVVHRDLKPSNLLISADGNLKLADFGQAKIIQGSRVINEDNFAQPELLDPLESHMRAFHESVRPINEFEYFQEVEDVKAKCSNAIADEASVQDGETSCLATCSTGEIEDDPFKRSYSYESGTMTSCVGTRWFRSPELLYGSTNYGLEVDLWSLGCVFAELLNLQPLFPGSSDIDQIGKIIHVLGDFNEETWLGCSKLPDYYKIAFNKVECPIGLEAIFRDHSFSEVGILKRLVVYDPAARATAAELLGDAYFKEEPLPVPLNNLNVPKSRGGQDERPSADWGEFMDDASDSDLDDFCGVVDVTNTDKGFSIKFS